jgi:hypothetical protein
MPAGRRDAGEPERRPPPAVMVVDLGGGHTEAVLYALHQTLDQTTLVLQTTGARQTQFGTSDADDDVRSSRRLPKRSGRHLLDFERFNDVAFLDVIEALQADTAFKTIRDFAHVVFEAAQ